MIRAIGIVIGSIVATAATLFVLTVVTTPFFAASGIIKQTFDSTNIIYNYEWFKQQYNDIAAMDVKVDHTKLIMNDFLSSAGPRKDWKFDDRQEFNRLNGVILGLENQRAAMIAEYNARAQMANRNIFRTSDLPEQLQ